MKIKIAVEARVSADRKRCLEMCPGSSWRWSPMDDVVRTVPFCSAYGYHLDIDHLGRPLRCRACLRAEVKP